MSSMGINISQQLTLFGQSILLGVAAALVYDLLRAFRVRIPRLTAALDVCFCLLLIVSVFLFVLHQAQGQLRGYVLLGSAGGAVLYFTLPAPFLRPVWDFWCGSVLFLLHLLWQPVLSAGHLCKKIFIRVKNARGFAQKNKIFFYAISQRHLSKSIAEV